MAHPLLVAAASAVALALATGPVVSVPPTPTNPSPPAAAGVEPLFAGARAIPDSAQVTVPTEALCRELGATCYSPTQLRRAYGLDRLTDAGDLGRGQTIVVVDAYGSPTLGIDLGTFDAAYGLPSPPALKVYTPYGAASFDASAAEVGWATETTLDVEWAHAIAPDADIDLLTSPVDETEGTSGLADFLDLDRFAVDHHLGDVLSQSWGVTEETLESSSGRTMVHSFESVYAKAESRRITVLAAAGDGGSANPSNTAQTEVYSDPTVNFPASSPYVTAIGGTHLTASSAGTWESERVWNDSAGAGGGGVSQLFNEPTYQKRLAPAKQRLLDGHRGLPDLSWDADPSTGILIYETFSGSADGWELIGGTSASTPQVAGMIADVDQARGNAVGFIDPDLYRLGRSADQYHAIIGGTNGHDGVKGYAATRGWNAATGWGTPEAGLISSLVRAKAQT